MSFIGGLKRVLFGSRKKEGVTVSPLDSHREKSLPSDELTVGV